LGDLGSFLAMAEKEKTQRELRNAKNQMKKRILNGRV